MKGNKKKLLVSVFFALILVTSTVAIVLPNILPKNTETPSEDTPKVTVTGTPMDNFPDEQRPQYCSSGDAKSSTYVKEFRIPTACTQPLAITVDPSGMVWFGETNTGKIGSFDPKTESFKEYDNLMWPKGARSMMWGMDYSPDGSIWYSDERFDSLWKFSIDEKKYNRIAYPTTSDSLPQRVQVAGSQIIINDFTGNKITFLDPTRTDSDMGYLNIPSPYEKSVTGGFAVDSEKHLWYTNWIFQQGGVLINLDYERYITDVARESNSTSLQFTDYIKLIQLPQDLYTPNGVSVDSDGKIWLADTTNSAIFKFDPSTEVFTKYMTSSPHQLTYGNATGLVKSPLSRPYWIETTQNGNLVFNEQAANRISMLDPKSESLVEYLIPSKNPSWGDCTGLSDCGIAQIFGFSISGDKIWFSEWVENNIGFVDTSKSLPLEISLDEQQVTVKPGDSISTTFSVSADSSGDTRLAMSTPDGLIDIITTQDKNIPIESSEPIKIPITISIGKTILPGTYKILLGAENNELTVSKYLTVTVQP